MKMKTKKKSQTASGIAIEKLEDGKVMLLVDKFLVVDLTAVDCMALQGPLLVITFDTGTQQHVRKRATEIVEAFNLHIKVSAK